MTESSRAVEQCIAATSHSYAIAANGNSIVFGPCGTISYSPQDITNRYCGRCHRFIGDIMKMEGMIGSMNLDAYNEVINGAKTYNNIATQLISGESMIVGWTDGLVTHYDVLFVMQPLQEGNLQGGLSGPNTLFVALMRKGAFGFRIAVPKELSAPLDPEYISEKLYVSGESAVRLADLINGVLRELRARLALGP